MPFVSVSLFLELRKSPFAIFKFLGSAHVTTYTVIDRLIANKYCFTLAKFAFIFKQIVYMTCRINILTGNNQKNRIRVRIYFKS